ncbi:MAG: type ISP restriction/modification enzyme [Azospirillaceae bacterium]
MSPVREFLAECHRIRVAGGGTAERSFYTPFQNMMNAIGAKRRPKVFCVGELADLGAGRPDFGFFSAERLPRDAASGEPLATPPDRGVVEMKPPSEDLWRTVASRQVADYWERYGLVLITNLRGFVIAGQDQFGRRKDLEELLIAETRDAFWQLCADPSRLSEEKALRLEEFLARVLLIRATLAQPRDVAWFLASYARDTLARLEDEMAAPPRSFDQLGTLRSSLEAALGITFEGPKGMHLFRSTLVQTLYYGLFAAWVLWCKRSADPEQRRAFSADGAVWHLRLPVLRQLFGEIYRPGALGDFGLRQSIDWAADMLRRVDDAAFFERFRQDRAVQYFYEPFLEAFDPQLRKQLGVWYTPPEVVDYMVERVDRVLRDELAIPDGLADERVHVLDPCCGTGSYIVAVLRRIERTLRERADDALIGEDIKRAAKERVHGFEIMPAPFVVAHLQVGLLLEDLGAPLAEEGLRTQDRPEFASIKLTNALTDWDSTHDQPGYLPFADLQNERDAARDIKRRQVIHVVLGNPPYNGYAGMADHPEERALTEAYRRVRRVRPPEGQGLNDLYVRFFRIADRKITEQSDRGVVCFITNYSWLDGLSYTGMRERYLDVFDRIWIDSLNGDKYRTGKTTPDGRPDPSIFSTEENREGIQVGTAISLLARRAAKPNGAPAEVHYQDFWGTDKRGQLVAAGADEGLVNGAYSHSAPHENTHLTLRPGAAAEGYLRAPMIVDLFPVSFPGVQPGRESFLVDIDFDAVQARLGDYLDPEVSDDEIGLRYPVVMQSTARFDARKTRSVLKKTDLGDHNIKAICYRPLDRRWLIWEPNTKLLDEKRADYVMEIEVTGSYYFSAANRLRKDFDPPLISNIPVSRHVIERGANMFGAYVRSSLHSSRTRIDRFRSHNLSENAVAYFDDIGLPVSEAPFWHAIAIQHSTAYAEENADALRLDWPRIPLPASAERLAASAALGRRVAALLDPETPADGVETAPHPSVRGLGRIARAAGAKAADLAVHARWGHAGQNGVTMPGRGDARPRAWTAEERAAVMAGAADLGLDGEQAIALLGGTAVDVHLNPTTFWACVPERVWRYTIGGYQVLKKWLSYREHDLLGRPLTTEEARYVTHVVRRLALLRLMEPALDANYRAVLDDLYPWPPG